jgi:hypothetical protein
MPANPQLDPRLVRIANVIDENRHLRKTSDDLQAVRGKARELHDLLSGWPEDRTVNADLDEPRTDT